MVYLYRNLLDHWLFGFSFSKHWAVPVILKNKPNQSDLIFSTAASRNSIDMDFISGPFHFLEL